MSSQNPLADRHVFEDEIFDGLELPNLDLSEKEFVRCTFKKMVLPESIWKVTRLNECVFDACDLTRMRPARIAAHSVAFLNCRMMGIDWSDVRFESTITFDGCNLQYASFVNVNLTQIRFSHCRLVEVNFLGSRLVEADFTDSDLRGSRFQDCDVQRANFAGTEGFVIDATRNKVKDARISVNTAVSFAAALGLRVTGFNDEPEEDAAAKRARSSRGGSPAKRPTK